MMSRETIQLSAETITKMAELLDHYAHDHTGLVLNVDGKVVMLDQAYTKTFGYSLVDFTEMNPYDMIHPDDKHTLLTDIILQNDTPRRLRYINAWGRLIDILTYPVIVDIKKNIRLICVEVGQPEFVVNAEFEHKQNGYGLRKKEKE